MPEIGASLVNPDAGSHPVTHDPREIAAAAAAAERSFEEFPYFAERYGERGRRFGHSDGAWLAVVAEAAQEQVNAEVLWLGGLLSSRGMPQVMLERHLEFLHDELVRAAPERSEVYGRLLAAAEMLRRMRERQISAKRCRELADAFAARAAGEWSARLPHAGELLVSAAADERMGITQAVPAIEGWMTDPQRFPASWIAAVRDTLAEARGLPGA
jgi:hypothetical protein